MILSIVTINKDNKEGLQQTLESLKNQTSKEVELIVIDGNSKDGSLDVIQTYSSIINRYISEEDSGIYNAMNKGIQLACGEYIYFLNAGDIWNNNITLRQLLEKFSGTDFIICSSIWKYNSYIQFRERLPRKMNGYDLYDGVCHQSTFARTELLKQEGFNEKELTADWQFLFKKIYLEKASYSVIHANIAIYDLHGVSSDFNTQKRIKREKSDFLKRYGINWTKWKYYLYVLCSRLIFKKIFMFGIWQIQRIKKA
ncbi:MAG: glycosyltransferase [Bacteroidales bacterium]